MDGNSGNFTRGADVPAINFVAYLKMRDRLAQIAVFAV
ncbi:hypothetical protein SAMN04515695_2305 [Pseudovibrio sp. Tun.PSC04-5.I4]|nr:hypothetical protein SAMN04515695_2305 [Pseudovibrio sp. Tun.PSC04-5.I4]